MGTIIGGTAMAGSLGMAVGPLAGGLIYDSLAGYAWLYIGACIMGVGAFPDRNDLQAFPLEAARAGDGSGRISASRPSRPQRNSRHFGQRAFLPGAMPMIPV